MMSALSGPNGIPRPVPAKRVLLAFILTTALFSGCTRYPPVEKDPDAAAEKLASGLRQVNKNLTRFTCVGKIRLTGPEQPAQSFRVAIAGKLDDQLRIDLFGPLGGAIGTMASNGEHLFLVLHSSRDFHKKRLGGGSLRRLIRIDITVGDLLELLVGRIPLAGQKEMQLEKEPAGSRKQLVLADQRGRIRQRITLDDDLRLHGSHWLDSRQRFTHRLTIEGRQVIDGFMLPKRLELTGADGQRAELTLERYHPNVNLLPNLFTPVNPWN
jgi:hypothetical protein